MIGIDSSIEAVHLPKAFEHIRKPESRSHYSNALSKSMHGYLTKVFEQDNEITRGLTKTHGLFVFEGSILRGTATEKTHDFDMFAVIDDKDASKVEVDRLSIAVRDIDDFHPNKIPFPDYLAIDLLSKPETKQLYEARLTELQRIRDYTDDKYGRPHGVAKTDPHFVIHTDVAFDTSSNVLRAIEIGDLAILRGNDTPSRLILSILSATPDLVFETTPGSLLYHQRKITKSLVKLKNDNPHKFDLVWGALESDFANLHRSTAWRDPLRDYKLLGEYYLRSGRFLPEHMTKDQLVELSAKQLSESVIVEEFSYYSQFDDYKNNKEKLIEFLVKKHGVKTGLNKDDIDNLVGGKSSLTEQLSTLRPEQLKELNEFKRKIQLLKSIRQQEKIPSLDELKDAYLN